jgi:hypothetical protein
MLPRCYDLHSDSRSNDHLVEIGALQISVDLGVQIYVEAICLCLLSGE